MKRPALPDDVIFDQVFDSLGRRTEVDATIRPVQKRHQPETSIQEA